MLSNERSKETELKIMHPLFLPNTSSTRVALRERLSCRARAQMGGGASVGVAAAVTAASEADLQVPQIFFT